MTRAKWIRRQIATYLIFLLAVNAAAGWARVLMGDPGLHEPEILSLAKPFMAALFLWWGVMRLIEDINIKVVDKDREKAP